MASTNIIMKTESNRRNPICFTLPIFVVDREHTISNNFLQSYKLAPDKPSKMATALRNAIIGNCDFGAGPHSETRTHQDLATRRLTGAYTSIGTKKPIDTGTSQESEGTQMPQRLTWVCLFSLALAVCSCQQSSIVAANHCNGSMFAPNYATESGVFETVRWERFPLTVWIDSSSVRDADELSDLRAGLSAWSDATHGVLGVTFVQKAERSPNRRQDG